MIRRYNGKSCENKKQERAKDNKAAVKPESTGKNTDAKQKDGGVR